MVVGIDPDVEKNGVAVCSTKTEFTLHSLTFFELFDFLHQNQLEIKVVVIEGGWLNSKSNFRDSKGAGTNARIGKNVGANHEVGRKIVEMCEYLDLDFHVVKPHKKVWKNGKISHDEINKLTGKKLSRTNQEQRDALLLVYGLKWVPNNNMTGWRSGNSLGS